jgi:hypothetical protein
MLFLPFDVNGRMRVGARVGDLVRALHLDTDAAGLVLSRGDQLDVNTDTWLIRPIWGRLRESGGAGKGRHE